jgi:hypothetical protein
MFAHEFVCEDCKAEVVSYDGPETQTRCASCETIRDMKAHRPMTAEAEAKLREILGNMIVRDANEES